MPQSFSKARDPVSCYTHFLGACGAVAATLLMILKGLRTGATLQTILCCTAFGLSLLALYSASALYHFYQGTDRILRRLRKLDHSIIYVLIAGTYTPLIARFVAPQRAVIFLSVIWGIALAGIAMKLCWLNAPRWLYTSLYLLLGWAIVFDLPAFRTMPALCLSLVAAGGIAYSVGAVIYLVKRPNPLPAFGFHELFHVFILIGSLFHLGAVYFFVL